MVKEIMLRKIKSKDNQNRCVSCGNPCPEGSWVCWSCAHSKH